MVKSFLNELLERADLSHQTAAKRMQARGYSLEEMQEQMKRNEEIRRQNILTRMKRE